MEQTSMKIFDSHELYNNLVHGGFNDKQANAIVNSIVKVNFQDVSHLATKEQLENTRAVLQQDINNVKTDLKKDMELLRQELKADVASVQFGVLKWILPFVLTNTIAILGIIVATFFRG